MLNSVTETEGVPRRRLSRDDRRRQLLGIGLRRLMETPIQDLSLDDVAAEAGISRGLLFHYFPTKTDFYVECLAAAGRRIQRNTAPDPDDPGEEQVRAVLRAVVDQIDRRRSFYLTLVHGSAVADPRTTEVHESVRTVWTNRVLEALDLPVDAAPLVHAWWAYVEDRVVTWSGDPKRRRPLTAEQLVDHCEQALTALLAVVHP